MKKLIRKKWFIICSSIVLIGIYMLLSIQFILKCDWAFCGIFFTGCLLTGLFAYLWKKYDVLKIIFINLSLLSLMLGCIELVLKQGEIKSSINVKMEGNYFEYPKGYWASHKILGYKPDRNKLIKAKATMPDGEILFDTAYKINNDGWRISPTPRIPNKGVLFFGGSFTYGECLKNNETFPWLIGVNTGYKVFNFGFHGYGPHQMLVGIEKGTFAKSIKGTNPLYAIYTAIPYHPERSGGWAHWDTYGPEYKLDDNGTAQYKGNFNNRISSRFLKALGRSAIYCKLKQAAISRAYEHDIKLAVAIVLKSQKLLQEKYPDINFFVLYWGPTEDFSKALKLAKIKVIMIEDIIPDYFKNTDRYLVKLNNHPNAHSAQLVTNYLAGKIILQNVDNKKKKRIIRIVVDNPVHR